MTVTNHAATGALVAIVIANPLVALPLAFISHFVLDSLPHFGYPGQGGYGELFKHRITYIEEAFSLSAFIVLLVLLKGQSLWVYIAGMVAISPDFMWPYRYFFFERKGLEPPGGKLTRFHQRIQWCERLWGIGVEVAMSILLLTIIYKVAK